MTVEQVEEQLDSLLELLKEERKAAFELNMHELDRVVECKRNLLHSFTPAPEDIKGLEGLVKQIDQENRRNAFLIWSGLTMVRETMKFFGQSNVPEVYGGGGKAQILNRGGRLLSGRI